MAYAKLSSMFTELNGRLGNVVFYKRLGRQCLRVYVIPRNPDTESQRANRHTFKDAVKSWKELPGEEKDYWNLKVRKMKKIMSGYNLYISEYMKRNRVNDTRTDTVQVRNSSGHDTAPLRSSYGSTPFMVMDSRQTASIVHGYSPG